MDDRRFDSLTKALASGANRRSVLKGLLGIGGAAAIGGTLPEGDADAARRRTSTTTTHTCPGIQHWDGTKCVCPFGLSQCNAGGGPTCCNDHVTVGPGYSECCDNACCRYPRQCVGEELCCLRLPDLGCLDNFGNCCATLCEETPGEVACCPIDDFCPGASGSPDQCCNGETPVKCHCGASDNACIPDTDEACCVAADCDTPPAGSSSCVTATCDGHVCHYHDCAAGSICCPDDQGTYACRTGGDECCLTNEQCAETCQICGPNWVCVDDPDAFPCGGSCCPNADTCCNGACCTGQCLRDQEPEICCTTGLSCPSVDGPDQCCDDPTQDKCCGHGCCRGQCHGAGDLFCCEKDTGFICNGECCPNANTCCGSGEFAICCPSGQCNAAVGTCCEPGLFPCGEGCCPNADTCCNGACCAGQCLRDQEPEYCCTTALVCVIADRPDECCRFPDESVCCGEDGCCLGHCYGEGDNSCCPKETGFVCNGECCPNANTCCTTDTGVETCCAPGQCNASTGQCCETGTFPCGEECCPNADTCCDGECCGGQCIRLPDVTELCCPSGDHFVCNGNECCDNDQNCCSADGCCSGHCDANGDCCPADTGFICGGVCCPNANICCTDENGVSYCLPNTSDSCCRNDQCSGSPDTCQTGVCRDDHTCALSEGCAGGGTCCGADGCVDTDIDNSNCGGCGIPCALQNAVAGCFSGVCRLISCINGFGNCDGDLSTGCETDIFLDSENCGGCGNKCPSSQYCLTGVCQDV